MKFRTQAIHIGNQPNFKEGGSGDIVTPIHISTTFARKHVYHPTAGYDYSRSGNPTRSALEKNLAALEHGQHAFAYASGLAAITNILLLLKPGDHIIAINNIYGGTHRLLTQVFKQWGIQLTLADFVTGQEITKHIQPNTKLIYLESPTNPLMKIVDISSITQIAKQKNILTTLDNTLASPYWQNPLDLGVDIVIHSATKYLSGHSDVTAGCVIVNDEKLAKQIAFLQNAVGAILSPMDSATLLKGIKTLPIRMEQQEKNIQQIITFLSNHKKIKNIYYPGLPTHPQHKIAKKQMRGFGAVASFELTGKLETAITFMESLNLFKVAISLGSVESLIEHPASMSHASIPAKDRQKSGLSDTLIRISVGIEDIDDQITDLSQALETIE